MVGGGVMGEALLSRLLSRGIFRAEDIVVGEPAAERRQTLAQTYGVRAVPSNGEVLCGAEVILLAVKPQVFPKIVAELAPCAAAHPLVLSIMAGIPLATLERAAPGCGVVRAMPNTPATVGAGITALALGQAVTPTQAAFAEKIFGAVGAVVTVPEALMDGVTGLSGSGPGYVAVMIEALADGGVAVGLPRAIAQQLAIQTVLGTATLLQERNLHPAILKDQVASPGGTTITGIAQLEAAGVRSAFIEAVRAACGRSQQLGN